jgi:hypothetical protein
VLPRDSLAQLLKAYPQLAAAAGVDASLEGVAPTAAAAVAGGAWRFLPAVTPAWEVVGAPAAPDHQQQQHEQEPQLQQPTGLLAPPSAVASAAQKGVSTRQQQQQQQQQVLGGMQSVPLPPLRFFLRRERDIRAAYIPSLDDWLQAPGGENS